MAEGSPPAPRSLHQVICNLSDQRNQEPGQSLSEQRERQTPLARREAMMWPQTELLPVYPEL